MPLFKTDLHLLSDLSLIPIELLTFLAFRYRRAEFGAKVAYEANFPLSVHSDDGASLLDFLNAQSDCRAVQLACLQLIGSTMTAAGQLNQAVGREVIQ